MQLGIRLHDVKQAPLKERLKITKEQGFACAHVALPMVLPEVSTADDAYTPGFAMYIKRLFAENGLDIAVLGCYLNLATPDEEALKATTHRYMAHIRLASLMGAGVVGTETGAPNADYHFEERCHTQEALDIFIKNVEPVVRYAEKMGVILAIEPVYRHIVCNPKRAREMLDRLASPNVQIIFDPVNLLEVCNYKQRDEIFAEAIDLLGDEIAVVHIKDFVIKEDKLISCAAGTGEMDYTQIIRFIKSRKPYIHETLEDTVPDNAVAARQFIQGLWDQA